jgi:hypothetical protein
MGNMKKIGLLFLTALFCCCQISISLAETDQKAENIQNGIKKIGERFMVFPESEFGNTLYYKKKRLVSDKETRIVDAIEVVDGVIYCGVDQSDQYALGYTGNSNSAFTSLGKGFYQLITEKGKRKLFGISPEKKVIDLLPRSNTASGLVFSSGTRAAFFHIFKGDTVETEDGKLRYMYSFKIHVVSLKTLKVSHLNDVINDFSPSLSLRWKGRRALEYKLSNGQKETISIR